MPPDKNITFKNLKQSYLCENRIFAKFIFSLLIICALAWEKSGDVYLFLSYMTLNIPLNCPKSTLDILKKKT